MPFVLIIAFAASLGMHGLVLFGPDVDLSIASEPPPLLVELQPLVKPVPPVELPAKPAAKAVPANVGRSHASHRRRRPARRFSTLPIPRR